MFVAVITLSSWRLFGRDQVKPSDEEPSKVNGVCTEFGTQESFLFGFHWKDYNMTRTIDCETGEATGGWVQSN